jgi:hypothetical protein
MSLDLIASIPDLFAQSTATAPQVPIPKVATAPAASNPHAQAAVSLGGILARVLKDDPAIKKMMTPAEQAAVAAVIKNVGTPDEYDSSMVYVLRALPYVRSVYAAMDTVQPIMPSNEEIAILMRSRFIE